MPMSRTGGGETILAYHLSALLAPSVRGAEPPDSALSLIDQPTQSPLRPNRSTGMPMASVQKTEKDADPLLRCVGCFRICCHQGRCPRLPTDRH